MRWGECSEDWAGACRWGGGEVEFLTEKKISAKKCSWGLKTPKKIFPTKILFSKMFLGF